MKNAVSMRRYGFTAGIFCFCWPAGFSSRRQPGFGEENRKAEAGGGENGYGETKREESAMGQIIEITDFCAPELDIYGRSSENELFHWYEPEE